MGFSTSDDAAVLYVDPTRALVQTVDFFSPMVDDPFLFGQIAAANALSDVYAMGGEPFCAMNIGCFPSCVEQEVIRDILRGGYSKCQEAGALLVGGHSVVDEELKFGMSVSGWVHPKRYTPNSKAKPRDVLVLTKPVGTGLLINGIRGEVITEEAYLEVTSSMAKLNKDAARVMVAEGIKCATDITGFGLLGHSLEIARASRVDLILHASQVPLFTQALELAQMGFVPKGRYANHKHVAPYLKVEGVEEDILDVLLDPQTSGGLLLLCPEQKLETLLGQLKEKGEYPFVIGHTEEGSGGVLVRR